jgi:hypothetical protein
LFRGGLPPFSANEYVDGSNPTKRIDFCLEAGYCPPVFEERGIVITETNKIQKAGGSPPLNEVGF